jgi:hypothetical protein
MININLNDIQLTEPKYPDTSDIELTFDDGEQDIIKLKITRNDAWQIANYCMRNLSYQAQLRRRGKLFSQNRPKRDVDAIVLRNEAIAKFLKQFPPSHWEGKQVSEPCPIAYETFLKKHEALLKENNINVSYRIFCVKYNDTQLKENE